MGLLSKIFSNTRKPEGFWGRMMVAGMNGGTHREMASWGLDFGDVPAEGEMLDIGCGGGANLQRLMQRSLKGKVTGVDYSPVSVEKSKATAFETVYFWPEIENSFTEVKRVLVPGGKFLIVNEDDGLSGKNEKWEKMIEGMHTYTPDELNKHLTAAGFREITIKRDETKHWLALTATK